MIEQDSTNGPSSSHHPPQEPTNGTTTTTATSAATAANSQRTTNLTIDTTTLTRVLSSMELLSQGFTTWEAYINASNVLRTLFTYANQPFAPSSAAIRQAIRQGAKNAIFTIAKNNHMSLIIGTLTFDTTHAKKIEHRLGCLKIISSFIRKVNYRKERAQWRAKSMAIFLDRTLHYCMAMSIV
jgi:hypothetical protein